MNLLLVLLDGPDLGVLAAMSLLFVVLPLVALILLIYFFIKRKNKNKKQ